MSGPRVQADPQSSLPFGEEAKPGFRTKTAATSLTPEELAEIEAAAEAAGQALSEWLRQTALCAARQRPAERGNCNWGRDHGLFCDGSFVCFDGESRCYGQLEWRT